MPVEIDWSPDFCLSCDCQTTDDVYCSQSCRLADIEQTRSSPGSEAVSPSTPSKLGSWPASGRSFGFYLAPAVNFDLYRSSPVSRPTALTSLSKASSSANTHSLATSKSISHLRPALSPSQSNSSLSSMSSSLAGRELGYLSDQAREELRGYASSFDRARDWKRRVTWG